MGQSASKEGRRLSQAIRRQDAQEVFRVRDFAFNFTSEIFFQLIKNAHYYMILLS